MNSKGSWHEHEPVIEHVAAQGGEVRMTLILAPGDGASTPAQLRFYALTRAKADVAFAFDDVLMP